MKNFIGIVPEKIVFGAGVLNSLPEHIKGIGKKALIVTTKSTRPEKLALIERVKELAGKAGIASSVYAEIEENPRTTTCNAGRDFSKAEGCDFVIGLGGGSSMDAAKMIAMLCASGGDAEDYLPGGKRFGISDKELSCQPIVAITTTSGTGSESTNFAVMTNPANNNKPGTGHTFWYPTVSIVDPELTLSVPKKVTLNTGLDTFYHAFEAYVCNMDNDYVDLFAVPAMENVIKYLKKCVDEPGNIEYRSHMAFANTLAGTAIALGGTYAIHGMAHSVSGHFDAAHGAALTAIAPEIMEFSYKGNIKKFAGVAKMLGGDPSKSDEELAAECAPLFEKFLGTLDYNISLSDLGVTEDRIRRMAEDAFFAMKGAMDCTPVPITVEDAVNIYKKAM